MRGELQDSYDAMGSDQLLGNMLTIGEIANAAAAAQEANGYEAA
ncbi:phage tail assembly chaperone [Lysinibacillus fusiformis]